MKNILVSGASGIVGYGILKSLKTQHIKLVGTTIYTDSPAECFADVIEIVPKATDESYINTLMEIIRKHNIDMLIPGIEADMIAWNQNRALLSNTGAFFLLNKKDVIDLCSDKWFFFRKLEENDFDCRIESSIEPEYSRFNTPFILKPRRGFGSKGIVKIKTKDEFNRYKDLIGETLMLQEFVGTEDEEYTVSVFFDKDSNAVASIAMKRKLSVLGYTEMARTVDFEPFENLIKELAELLKPIGPTNFQFRKQDGKWKLLEINPRISSSTSIKAAFGFNESIMSVDYFLNHKKILEPNIRKGKAIRYTEDYIEYDSNNI